MNEQFEKNVGEAYSRIINSVDISRPYAVSFDGSQKPFEFFSAWSHLEETLSKTETPTFLEIGAYKGLWAIAFFEWCKLNNKKGRYTTVTWMEQNPANSDLTKVIQTYRDEGFECNLIDRNSQLQETLSEVQKPRVVEGYNVTTHLYEPPKFDMVLIDADHTYEGSYKDIQLYAPLAKVLLFHDIRPIEKHPNCGVYKAIQDSEITLDYEIACAGDMMGIGIKFYE